MRFFWISAIFSGRQSSPRLPREMMTPSASFRTPLKLSSAWRLSSLAKILVDDRPTESRKSRAF
jgi:hypothetical protein